MTILGTWRDLVAVALDQGLDYPAAVAWVAERAPDVAFDEIAAAVRGAVIDRITTEADQTDRTTQDAIGAIAEQTDQIRAAIAAAIAGGAGPFGARDHAMRETGRARLRCALEAAHAFRARHLTTDQRAELELLDLEIVNGLAVRQRAKGGADAASVRTAQRDLAATVQAWSHDDEDVSADEDAGRGLAALALERTQAAAVADHAAAEGIGPAAAVALALEGARDRVAVSAVLDVYRRRDLDATERRELAVIDAAVLKADQAGREELVLDEVLAMAPRRGN